MATLQPQYDSVQDFTITLASLAIGDGRAGVYVDNTTDLFDDVLVYLHVEFDSDPGSTGQIYVGMYSSLDGTNWTGSMMGIDGTDKAIPAFATDYVQTYESFEVVSIYSSSGAGSPWVADWAFSIIGTSYWFGQTLPPYWGIVVLNSDSAPLTATPSDHKAQYMGVYAQSV
jgi:hypothetical protein